MLWGGRLRVIRPESPSRTAGGEPRSVAGQGRTVLPGSFCDPCTLSALEKNLARMAERQKREMRENQSIRRTQHAFASLKMGGLM